MMLKKLHAHTVLGVDVDSQTHPQQPSTNSSEELNPINQYTIQAREDLPPEADPPYTCWNRRRSHFE